MTGFFMIIYLVCMLREGFGCFSISLTKMSGYWMAVLKNGKKELYSIELKSNPLKYSKFRGKIDVEVLATAQDVMRSLNNKNVVIVDARSRKGIRRL